METMELAINVRSALHSPAPGLQSQFRLHSEFFPVWAQPLPQGMENRENNKTTVYSRPLYTVDVTQAALYELSSLIFIKLSLHGSIPISQTHKRSCRKATCSVTYLGMIAPQGESTLQTHTPNSRSSPGACPSRTCSPLELYIPDFHSSSPGSPGSQGVELSDRHACFPWGPLCTIKTRRQASSY